ncbi:MAG: hypothetical protein KKD59_08425 [Acidobacteria bacterium]|nr:hypothetical protein [Acidobacteriota bacterium]
MNRTPDKWLKYHFRKGDYDHESLMALIGGLSCLDDRALEEKRLEIEEEMIRLDHYADGYFKR